MPSDNLAHILSSNNDQFLEFFFSDLETRLDAGLSVGVCSAYLDDKSQDLYELSPQIFATESFKVNGEAWAKRAWLVQMDLHALERNYYDQGLLNRECALSIRELNFGLRYFIDYAAEASLKIQYPDQILTGSRPLEGPEPDLFINPDQGSFLPLRDLKTGDVLVSLGGAYSSAGIAMLGQEDSQFSHNAIIYKDEKTGDVYTIESFIEHGVVVRKLDPEYTDGKVRSAVFRFEDAERAKRAVTAAYEYVTTQKKIKYDNGFDFENHDMLSCSEITSWAYGQLIGEERDIPLIQTEVPLESNKDLFGKLGLETDFIFGPGDLEMDPRFKLIAEWRDYGKMERIRTMDMIVERIYDWVEIQGYDFHPDASMKLLTSTAWMIRKVPLAGLILKKKMSSYMRLPMVQTVYTLTHVAEKIEAEVNRLATEYENIHGHAMTTKQIKEALEKIRDEDFRRWQSGDKKHVIFHDVFHP